MMLFTDNIIRKTSITMSESNPNTKSDHFMNIFYTSYNKVKNLLDPNDIIAPSDARCNYDHAFCKSIMSGNLDAVKAIKYELSISSEDKRNCHSYALIKSAEKGYLSILEYVIDEFDLTDTSVGWYHVAFYKSIA